MKRYGTLFHDTAASLPYMLRRLWKGISIRNLVIGIQIGRFDAKECAVAYGAANALLYSTLGLMQSMMRVQIMQTDVQCAFGTQQTNWIVQGKGKACPLAILSAGCSMVIHMAMRRGKERNTEKSGGNHHAGKTPDSRLNGCDDGKNPGNG